MKLTAYTRIRSNLETVWSRTQVPDEHVRWDIRFTHIDYLPKPHPDQAQRFRYTTRIGFGMRIDGEGETVGHADQRGSALRFWSDDYKSLIRRGSGGWTYKPDGAHIHFGTVYDYEPRYGLIGRLVDSLVFRPLMIWGTRWSFDRLRLWIEKGLTPEISFRLWAIKVLARVSLGLVWIYEGLVPKVLFVSQSETDLVLHSRLFWGTPADTLRHLGLAEVLFGLWIIAGYAERISVSLATTAVILLSLIVIYTNPLTLADPLGGLSKNLGLIACAVTVYCLAPITPAAHRAKPQSPDLEAEHAAV